MEKQNNHYEKELAAINKETNSIVGLLMRFGVREKREGGEKPLWDSRVKIWEGAVAEIQKTEKNIDTAYKGSTKQNIALLNYVRSKILAREMLDPKTLAFVPAGAIKEKAIEERNVVKREIGPVLKSPDAAAIPAPQKAAPALEPQTRGIESSKDVLKEVSYALTRFLVQNRNRPYDTSKRGADGYARSDFRKNGTVEILDNITGKLHRVDRNPAKASKVTDWFGREKLLTGTPMLCDDVITEFLPQVGIRLPAERSVAILETYFSKHPDTYTMFPQNVKFEGYGKECKPSVPCQVGDIITSSRGSGRHIFIVMNVDSKGVPTEVMDSSAINQGVGLRPFIGKNPSEDLIDPDFHGNRRSKAVVGPGIALSYVIRPRYQTSLQNLVKAKKGQSPQG